MKCKDNNISAGFIILQQWKRADLYEAGGRRSEVGDQRSEIDDSTLVIGYSS